MYFKGKTIEEIKGSISVKEGLIENNLMPLLYDEMYTIKELYDLICFSIKEADINNKFEYGK